MPLIENTLDGRINRVEVAIERLRAFEPEDGLYLAFSGGKDSVVLKRLAEMSGVRWDGHYNLTTVDPPELVQFVRREHKDVEVIHPEKTMWELIIQHKWPPLRTIRYCCKALKETAGIGHLVLTGIRWAESRPRSRRHMVEICQNDPRKKYLHPIIDWPNDAVWEFIRTERIPYCGLYDEGWKRLGCILCPMASERIRRMEVERWPKLTAAYVRTFQRLIDQEPKCAARWRNGEHMLAWWLNSRAGAKAGQSSMFA